MRFLRAMQAAALLLLAIGCNNNRTAPNAPHKSSSINSQPSVKRASVSDRNEEPAANAPPVTAKAPATPASFEDVRNAMAELVSAVLARDPARVLGCFSQTKPWKLTSVAGGKRSASRYTYAQLKAGLEPGGDFRDVIFGYSPDDNFRQEVAITGDAPWLAKGTATFTPPGEPRDVFVTWSREGRRFVVAEIAFPF